MEEKKSRPRLSDEEKANIKSMLRNGYTIARIEEITHRSCVTIQRLRNELKYEEGDNYHRGGVLSSSIPCAPFSEKEIQEQRQEKLKTIQSIIPINKTVEFVGCGTAFVYTVGSKDEELSIKSEGIELKIPYDLLDKFAEEMLDIATEIKRIKMAVVEL